ncbi:unnamed protein product [Peronospora destructor]|uniref:Glycosyltransferase 61 catalytic domain-containing protein n=1 Tax=Peronospora destructor TaxID=86335 RepID=A0AAV0T418_9STRA|nr:unnamed protein product [Peronospora destructor]
MAKVGRIVFRVTRWSLLQTLTVVLLLLGALTTITRIVNVSSTTGSLRNDTSQSVSSVPGPKSDGPLQMTITPANSAVVQPKNYRVRRIKTPDGYDDTKSQIMCNVTRDMGMISALRQTANEFCLDGGWDREKEAPVSRQKATKVSLYRVDGAIKSATFQNLMLDLVNVAIHRPIKTMADDGGDHDPRFVFNMRLINCVCDELADYFGNLPRLRKSKTEQIWFETFMGLPRNQYPRSTICSPTTKRSEWDFVTNPIKGPDANETVVVFEDPVVLIARKDDHNPFFQVAAALDSWIMLKALKWDITKTRVIYLDAGYPMSISTLHKALLAPNHEIIDGTTLMGKRVHFRGNVLLVPLESRGPMMQHLNDEEPCYESKLIKTFRTESLQALNITPEFERELGVTKIRPIMVTIISRRPYGGRSMRRIWENEDEVLASMQVEYKDLNVKFRSVDYVSLTLHEQMKTTIESDMIISMHGAGLANVIWMRPMTTVVEIFPKQKARWGYRNMCQFVGCDWHQFRGGQDVNARDGDPNEVNKVIPYDEWMAFFRPLLQETYDAFNEQQTLREEAL